ncbi:unnamed protein product, partial [Chrysoparadoxa australica]
RCQGAAPDYTGVEIIGLSHADERKLDRLCAASATKPCKTYVMHGKLFQSKEMPADETAEETEFWIGLQNTPVLHTSFTNPQSAAFDAPKTAMGNTKLMEQGRACNFFSRQHKLSGSKVYYSPYGSSCHWCRQKTVDKKTVCSGCRGANGMICGPCLHNRYGEDILAVLK